MYDDMTNDDRYEIKTSAWSEDGRLKWSPKELSIEHLLCN